MTEGAMLLGRRQEARACPEEERSDDVGEAISSHTPKLPRPRGGLAVTAEAGSPVYYIVTELLEGETLRTKKASCTGTSNRRTFG